ncbi:MAG: quinolinate synthase NadA [Oscillospiraceae bacterium]|nr:quinolinate synthase NadA [Oscillospiraceae bacterium]
MTVREVQDSILKIKKEKNICILAHAYQSQDIWEVADYIGDSFGLSQKAAQAEADTFLMCGVRFMAETVKILSPEKKVVLSNPSAGCPMADQMDTELIEQLKEEMPGYTVAAYINTTAELKQICDVGGTSSSAVKIIRNIDNDKILFIPDCNLGDWIAKQVPEKHIELVRGGCPTHLRINQRDIDKARRLYPEALMLVHPECHPSVVAQADFVGSTTEIMEYAEKGKNSSYIIGTENSIVEHLQFCCPDKKFIPLSKDCVCHNMKATTLIDVYNCVCGTGGEEILMSDTLIENSRKCIDEMLRLGK